MSAKGMDVEAVRRMAKEMGTAAEEITRLKKDMTAQVEAVDWEGPDAKAFRAKWGSEMLPELERLHQQLTALETKANHNASEQAQTSSR